MGELAAFFCCLETWQNRRGVLGPNSHPHGSLLGTGSVSGVSGECKEKLERKREVGVGDPGIGKCFLLPPPSPTMFGVKAAPLLGGDCRAQRHFAG